MDEVELIEEVDETLELVTEETLLLVTLDVDDGSAGDGVGAGAGAGVGAGAGAGAGVGASWFARLYCMYSSLMNWFHSKSSKSLSGSSRDEL